MDPCRLTPFHWRVSQARLHAFALCRIRSNSTDGSSRTLGGLGRPWSQRREVVPSGMAIGDRARRLLEMMDTPDGQTGWIIPAVLRGRQLIRKGLIQHLLSSGPLWSNHLVGLWLGQADRPTLDGPVSGPLGGCGGSRAAAQRPEPPTGDHAGTSGGLSRRFGRLRRRGARARDATRSTARQPAGSS